MHCLNTDAYKLGECTYARMLPCSGLVPQLRLKSIKVQLPVLKEGISDSQRLAL